MRINIFANFCDRSSGLTSSTPSNFYPVDYYDSISRSHNVYKYAHANYEPMIYTHDMHLTISRYFYAHFDAMIHSTVYINISVQIMMQ